MGAWSHGPFDNDDAADWLSELLEQDTMTMIVDAFCAVTRPANSEDDDDYIEIPEASIAVAAAQVLRLITDLIKNTANGETSDEPSPEIRDWCQQFQTLKPTRKWYVAALEALHASAHRKNSELYEVWNGSTEYGEWRESIDSLRTYFKHELKSLDSNY